LLEGSVTGRFCGGKRGQYRAMARRFAWQNTGGMAAGMIDQISAG
jgi:hypothetical protein